MKTNLVFWHFFKPSIWLKGLFALSISGFCLLVGCKDDTISPDVPIVVVGEVTDINTAGATFHGQIMNEVRGFNEVGFVWDESASPAYASSRKEVQVEKGIRHFSARISADHQTGKGYTVKAYLKTGDKFTFSNTVKFTSLGSLPPEIADFSPKSGVRNTEVTIYGKNFSTVLSHINVKIGEIVVPVIASTDSTITVKIPQNIYTSGTVKITVSVLGKSTASIDNFELGGVFIESFSPKTTSCYGRITIKGKKFTLGSNTYVYFRLISDNTWDVNYGEILRLTDTEIDVKVPALYQGLDYKIQVTSGGYEAEAEESFTMQGPEIISIEPLQVFSHDTVSVTGKTMKEVFGVAINDIQMDVISRSDNQVKAIIPEITAGEYFIKVSNNCMHITTFPTKITVNSLWKTVSNIPISTRIDAVSLAIGDKLYVGLGNDMCTTTTDYLNDWWELNAVTEKWTRKADFPGVGRQRAVATVVDGKFVIGSGLDNSDLELNDFWIYDPVTDEWQSMNPAPNPPRYNAIAFSAEGRLFYGIGRTNSYVIYTDFYEYDFAGGIWLESYSYPGEINPESFSYFTVNNTGYYLINPYWSYYQYLTLHSFTPSEGWNIQTNLDFLVNKVITNDQTVIFIKEHKQPVLVDNQTFEPIANLPSFYSTEPYYNYFGAIANDRLYIGFGLDPNGGCYNDIIYLNLNDYR